MAPRWVEGISMNVSLATGEPGKGAPLHDHSNLPRVVPR